MKTRVRKHPNSGLLLGLFGGTLSAKVHRNLLHEENVAQANCLHIHPNMIGDGLVVNLSKKD